MRNASDSTGTIANSLTLLGNTGKIETLLLVLPAFMVPCLEPACRSLLAQLSPEMTLVVVTHKSTTSLITSWLEECGLTQRTNLITIADNIALSMWVQDDVHVLANSAGNHGLLMSQLASAHVHDVMKQIAKASDMSFTTTPDTPDGGNILAGDDFIVVGGDDWGRASQHSLPGYSARRPINAASKLPVPVEFKRFHPIEDNWEEVIHYGSKPETCQPVFHIDIFLALAGKNSKGAERILVGDPTYASRLLETDPIEHSLQDIFDDIAERLSTEGFEVIRNPLPLVYCDVPDVQQRHWYFASGNNAIVQHCLTDSSIVWMPTYGYGNWPELEITDRENAAIWQQLGFEVREIADCQPLAENFGGLRCFSKILKLRP